jgi:hypothetical protein
MLYNCYLKKDRVYLPTVVHQATAVYMDVEPVTIVPATDTDRLRRALLETISKPNAFVPASVRDAREPSVVLKHSGDKSWPAFQRGASCWVIKHKGGQYKIAGYRTHSKGYWEEDPEQIVKFPPGTTVDSVIDRMIAILQSAAHQ